MSSELTTSSFSWRTPFTVIRTESPNRGVKAETGDVTLNRHVDDDDADKTSVTEQISAVLDISILLFQQHVRIRNISSCIFGIFCTWFPIPTPVTMNDFERKNWKKKPMLNHYGSVWKVSIVCHLIDKRSRYLSHLGVEDGLSRLSIDDIAWPCRVAAFAWRKYAGGRNLYQAKVLELCFGLISLVENVKVTRERDI